MLYMYRKLFCNIKSSALMVVKPIVVNIANVLRTSTWQRSA